MNAQELAGLKKREQLRSFIESMNIADLMTKGFEYVSPDEQLSDVLKKMGTLDLHEIPVSLDGKKLSGVVSYGTLLKRRNLSTSTKAGSIAVVPQEIGPGASVTEVAEAFLTSGYRQIPVVKSGVIQGIISRTDLIKVVNDIRDLKELSVADIMTEEVQTVRSEDPVEKALMTMKNLSIRTLPVVDNEGRLSGIVSIKQVADYNWRERRRETLGEITGSNTPVEVKVSSIAHDTVFTAEPDAELGKAVDLMLSKKVSALPVIQDDELVGILTKYDIIELLASFRQRDMVYTQITGLEKDDRFSLDQMEREITTSLQKIAKISRPMLFTMHVTKYNSQGNNYKYAINGRLITENKIWVASAVEWDLIRSTQTLMQHFERRVIEKKEEKLNQRKRSRTIGHS